MTFYYVNIDLVVPISTLLDDDSKRNQSKPGNNMKQQSPPSTCPNNSATPDKKKAGVAQPWNVRLRSRLCLLVFGKPTLHSKAGQKVQIVNRPVINIGTISYVGKPTSSPDASKKNILANHDIFLDKKELQEAIIGA